MTIHIFSLKITIQKEKFSKADFTHKQQIQNMMDEAKEKQAPYCNYM